MGGVFRGGRAHDPVYLPRLLYVGGETITIEGQSTGDLTIPARANIVEIDAEGGEIYYQINGTPASPASYGYIPEDGARWIGPVQNLTGIGLYSTSGATAHVMYWRETNLEGT